MRNIKENTCRAAGITASLALGVVSLKFLLRNRSSNQARVLSSAGVAAAAAGVTYSWTSEKFSFSELCTEWTIAASVSAASTATANCVSSACRSEDETHQHSQAAKLTLRETAVDIVRDSTSAIAGHVTHVLAESVLRPDQLNANESLKPESIMQAAVTGAVAGQLSKANLAAAQACNERFSENSITDAAVRVGSQSAITGITAATLQTTTDAMKGKLSAESTLQSAKTGCLIGLGQGVFQESVRQFSCSDANNQTSETSEDIISPDPAEREPAKAQDQFETQVDQTSTAKVSETDKKAQSSRKNAPSRLGDPRQQPHRHHERYQGFFEEHESKKTDEPLKKREYITYHDFNNAKNSLASLDNVNLTQLNDEKLTTLLSNLNVMKESYTDAFLQSPLEFYQPLQKYREAAELVQEYVDYRKSLEGRPDPYAREFFSTTKNLPIRQYAPPQAPIASNIPSEAQIRELRDAIVEERIQPFKESLNILNNRQSDPSTGKTSTATANSLSTQQPPPQPPISSSATVQVPKEQYKDPVVEKRDNPVKAASNSGKPAPSANTRSASESRNIAERFFNVILEQLRILRGYDPACEKLIEENKDLINEIRSINKATQSLKR